MRNFGPNDPIPCNVFNSDTIELIDVDDSPRFEPSERTKRLPSFRAVQEQKWEQMAPSLAILNKHAICGKPLLLDDSRQSTEALSAFNGNCDPHITEADCRKKVEPAQPSADADGWIDWNPASPIPAGDRFDVQVSINGVCCTYTRQILSPNIWRGVGFFDSVTIHKYRVVD